MQKAVLHFGVFLCMFFALWWSISHIPFIELSHIEEFSKNNEQKIGNLIMDVLRESHPEMDGVDAGRMIDSIQETIVMRNGLKEKTTISILRSNEINAFALPNNNLVIYSALIDYCNTPEELAGVMAHELAHIEHHHVSKKLAKEIGISVLAGVADKNVGSVIVKQIAQTVTSTGYDRAMERDADESAVTYLSNAGIDPEHLANFLLRLSNEKNNLPKAMEWISTHPDTKERTADILSGKSKILHSFQPLLSDSLWKYLKATLGTSPRKQ